MKSIVAHIREYGGLLALAAAAFSVTCIAAAPASLLPVIAGAAGANISYQNIEGTIWRGKFFGVSTRGAPLGDIEYTLSALSLLSFSPKVQVKSANGAVRGEGQITFGAGGRIVLSDAVFDVDLGPFARQGVLGMPVQGEARLQVEEIRVSQRGCEKAAGEVWTNILEAPAKQYSTGGFPMSGVVSCDNADLLLDLSGSGENGEAELALRISPDLTYELVATARPSEADIASVLRLFGFEDNDGALIYGSAGVLRGVGS
jgi:type II secretion system (T2SS) protein N